MAQQRPRQWIATDHVPRGFRFRPDGRDLVAHYLFQKAQHGAVTGGLFSDGVDIYSKHPADIPFPYCNQSQYEEVWSYFFEAEPIGDDYRATPEGFWCCYGHDKPYADDGSGGHAVAFRSRFAFYENDWKEGKLTEWRMKEYRLNKDAPHFRGVVFDAKAKDSVICKVYNVVEIPEEPPGVPYDVEYEVP